MKVSEGKGNGEKKLGVEDIWLNKSFTGDFTSILNILDLTISFKQKMEL